MPDLIHKRLGLLCHVFPNYKNEMNLNRIQYQNTHKSQKLNYFMFSTFVIYESESMIEGFESHSPCTISYL